MVVDLEECPCEHFLRGEEVVDVGFVMGFACVAETVLDEGPSVCGVCRGPEVEC